MHIGPHRSAAPSASAATRASAPALAAVVLAAAAVSGCSSDSGGGSATEKALRQLPKSAASKQVTYVDQTRVHKLSASDKKRYMVVANPAASLLNSFAGPPWGDTLKPEQITSEVDSGELGVWKGDFDSAAVIAKLKAAGYKATKKDGKDVLTYEGTGDSHSGELTILVTDDEVRYSGNTKTFRAVDPDKGDSLAGSEQYGRAADCLGDVYRADFNTLNTKEAVQLTVLGQVDDGGKNTEVMCVVTKDQDTADDVAGRLKAAAAKKPDVYGGTKVTVTEGDLPYVRVVVPDRGEQRPGRILVSNIDLWLALPDED
ncbi:hypothetical protein [Streptomyces sp. NPDC021020]|uniref:hypothetical protein n=1 Tax=Streptomyces sp. NPDC021020 TaxID=3365109 RepID=UPI0037AF74A0